MLKRYVRLESDVAVAVVNNVFSFYPPAPVDVSQIDQNISQVLRRHFVQFVTLLVPHSVAKIWPEFCHRLKFYFKKKKSDQFVACLLTDFQHSGDSAHCHCVVVPRATLQKHAALIPVFLLRRKTSLWKNETKSSDCRSLRKTQIHPC